MTPQEPVLPSYPISDETLLQLTWGADQRQYRPLPALQSMSGSHGRMTTRWRLTWRERLEIFLGGNLWLQVLTFHERLQPLKPLTREPSPEECL